MSAHSVALGDVAGVVFLVIVALAVALIAGRLRFPYTLALVLVGLALGFFRVLPNFQFNPELVLFIFLPALLFEGAWNLNVKALLADWRVILLLAVPGLLLSLFVIAVVVHWGAGLPFLVALLLGTIISPTDPIAVLSLLKQLGMPARLRTIIDGESLFNDGVGAAAFAVVLGLLLLSIGAGGALAGLSSAAIVLKALWLFLGGPLVGFIVGFIVSRAVRRVDDHLIETAVTFSVAYGVYVLGEVLGTSGLLAVVCAALVLGNYGREIGMSRRTRYAVDDVWEFTGYLANSLLFLLLGHQIGATNLASQLPLIAWAVVAVFAGRALMIYLFIPLHNLAARLRTPSGGHAERGQGRFAPIPHVWRALILFSGLRGALSLALALSLPDTVPQRTTIELAVFGVVLVTLLGQGIGLRFLLPRWPRTAPPSA
ncbi:MAG TPA: sodium:proton antiporter [Ktedonobacterales bacterium]|nr:sodium:proton antiporter [Ktedonobacterales bacterium]